MPCGLFPKTTFDGVILFQSTVLPSAPLETTGGDKRAPLTKYLGIRVDSQQLRILTAIRIPRLLKLRL